MTSLVISSRITPVNKILTILFFALTALNIYLASWYVQQKDIHFYTDVARDFLLFQEVDQKKIILIGPRSSAAGLYHGPVWVYLNYPAYLLGHGDPVTVGWYWILLICCFLISGYFLAKKLFNQTAAWFFILLSSVFLIFQAREFFNPLGAFFVMPAFFFFFIRYLESKKVSYLLLHITMAGLLIQFQLAVGIPMTLLSFIAAVYITFKNKQLRHLLAYALLIVLLANFLLFDLKHQFILTKAALHNFIPTKANSTYNLAALLLDRQRLLFHLPLVYQASGWVSFWASLIFIAFLVLQLWNKKDTQKHLIYMSFLYFYLGYVLLSFTSRDIILTHQYLPLIPLVFLIFASFVNSKYAKVFLVVFIIVYSVNLSQAITYVRQASDFIGKDRESWKFLYGMAQKAHSMGDKTFGYFVYSPDSLAYQSRYALLYADSQSKVAARPLKKEQITYVIAEPPPTNNPYMQDKWWVENKLKITKKPAKVITFPNGYKIEKYVLTKEETKVPFDPTIDVGLTFR